TLAMRAGDFSASGIPPIYDPTTRVYTTSTTGTATQFPGNRIPTSRINPAALTLMSYYPAPTVPGNSIVRNYVRQAVSPTDSDQFNQRFDYIQNASSSWFGRFSWGNDLSVPATTFLTDTSHAATTVRQGVLANTHIISASVVNEARFAWNQFNNDLAGFYANTTNVQATLGIEGLFAASPLAYGLPQVAIGGGLSSYGGVTPWITRNNTFQGLDGVSIIKGSHSIKIGIEIRRDRYNQNGNQKATGEFDFDGQSTNNPASPGSSGYNFADFIVGAPSQAYRVVALANGMLRRTSYAGYVQDDWKITPNLTLNLGLRYENPRPWHDKYRSIINAQVFTSGVAIGQNGVASVIPNSQSPILTRPGAGDFYDGLNFRYATGQPVQAGDQFMGRSLVNPYNKNFGPRIGLAYSPGTHWSFRAGFGIFYVQDIGNAVFDMSRNLAGRDGNVIAANARIQDLQSPWASEQASPLCPGWSGTCLNAPQILANYQGNSAAYVEQYMVNIQRELSKNIVLEAGYLGNQGHHLNRFVIINQAVPKTGPADNTSTTQRRPFPSFGPIQEVAGVVNSTYNAGDVKLTQRFSHGLTYIVGFTWSRAIDNGSALRTNSGDTLWPTNSYNLRAERGPSQFNQPHRFIASYVYELPFGPNKPFVNHGFVSHIVGGWQVGGILTLADGTSYNVTQLGDTAGLGTLGNQPDATGISPIPTNRSAQQFWNIAAINVSNPALSYRPGNMGRNTLSTPGTTNFDASLTRNIRLWESHSMLFRFEAFNSLNHPNWNTPSADARNPSTFGVVTTAKPMRQLQFAIKYSF
ncbi:MAG TPA: TonB-dependent receptor, partial [Bryobacteraceae bacterium]|nr:TonB-dependent receptor [Bryobacteraceae bacterium]